MCWNRSSWSVLVLFVFSAIWGASMGDPRTTLGRLNCDSARSVSSSEQADNFVAAMANLSSVIDQNGFAVAIRGHDASAVFGLAQCFGDLSTIDCRLCFSEIRNLLPKCYPRIGGRVFFDGCFGRFSNVSFFKQALDSEDTNVCSLEKNTLEPIKFREAVAQAIRNVSSEAQKAQGFSVTSVSVSKSTVYALAQCWESLDREGCNSCLNAASASVMSCPPQIEGRALNVGCYMRYATWLFWNLNQTSSHSSGTRHKLKIILGTLFGAFVFLACILFWITKRYRRHSKNPSPIDDYSSGLPSGFSMTKLNIPYKELKRATNSFHSLNRIGQGSHGTVYKGVLSDGKEVAVKRLFFNTRQWLDQFFNEVELVNQVRHKNLVKLLGCSADGPESLLVYEYYSNGSLDRFLFDNRHTEHLDWAERLDIIQGIADGLYYLHEESEVRIIHRDIKASNILLDDKLRPKITDFGLARSFGPDLSHLSTGVAGTLGYMAPEYAFHGHLTEKADIYSFGVLILEIIMGERCSNSSGSENSQFFLAKIWRYYKANKVQELIDRAIFEDHKKDGILHVIHVALLCTQATPGLRPTMAQVVEFLRSDAEQGDMIPTDPPVFDVIGMDSVELLDGSSSSLPLSSGSRF